MAFRDRPVHAQAPVDWFNSPDWDLEAGMTVAQWQQAALEHAQQVGEDVAQQMTTYRWERQPCPACGRQLGDHSRRELRRCDNTRPDLQIVR